MNDPNKVSLSADRWGYDFCRVLGVGGISADAIGTSWALTWQAPRVATKTYPVTVH